MEKSNEYYFFYKTRHPFSNWHPCLFEDEQGNQYNCSEQYMMAQKALLFGDQENFENIMNSSDPRIQKEFGRAVKGFDSKIWEENAKRIVYEGCKLKFEQNPKLLNDLLNTNGKKLVEASPTDRVWGIGLAEDDPRIHDPKNWRGTNWLGEVLTKLRDDILDS